MSATLTNQYNPALSGGSDACVSGRCGAMLGAGSSLSQGREFAEMTRNVHGGRRRKGTKSRKHRKGSRRSGSRKFRQHGGVAEYPTQFGQPLISPEMHNAADVGKLDTAFGQLPSFVGKYGGVGGRRRRSSRARKTRGRKMRGGGFGYTPGPAFGSGMILSPAEEPKAFLNPQWYTENQVVPSFQGPTNAFAQQSYNNQFNYAQRAGSRRRKGSRRHRKISRKNCARKH